jgi:lipoate-protein ligase A
LPPAGLAWPGNSPLHPRLIDLSLDTAEENLALDEALFLLCEAEAKKGRPVAFLRFWESRREFVVLGVSSRLHEDVEVERCRTDGVRILRRVSGGGTVLQGSGCLNFALVVPLAASPALGKIESSYSFIVERTAALLGIPGAARRGTCDLAVGDRKFGGSAQKRSRLSLLHQGTVLYAFALASIPRYLKEPVRRPDYRGRRGHLDFLTNISLSRAEIQTRLAAAWAVQPVEATWRPPALEELIETRYSRREWTERF